MAKLWRDVDCFTESGIHTFPKHLFIKCLFSLQILKINVVKTCHSLSSQKQEVAKIVA